MDNPAQLSDLANLGYDEGKSVLVQERWLDVAWRALCREVRTLPDQLEQGEINQQTVADVVAQAALRVLRNGDGVVEDSGAIDDFQENRKLADATQDVYFTAAEIRRVQPVDQFAGGAWAGSIRYC